MYDHLVQMGSAVPVPGNKAGSYLTAFSLQGFYTDITGIIAGFVQIFVDQSYWQSAVAASPTQAVKVSLVAFLSKYICVMTLYAVIVTADLMSTQLSLRWMHRCAVGLLQMYSFAHMSHPGPGLQYPHHTLSLVGGAETPLMLPVSATPSLYHISHITVALHQLQQLLIHTTITAVASGF